LSHLRLCNGAVSSPLNFRHLTIFVKSLKFMTFLLLLAFPSTTTSAIVAVRFAIIFKHSVAGVPALASSRPRCC
jgi:hypothetical protein